MSQGKGKLEQDCDLNSSVWADMGCVCGERFELVDGAAYSNGLVGSESTHLQLAKRCYSITAYNLESVGEGRGGAS